MKRALVWFVLAAVAIVSSACGGGGGGGTGGNGGGTGGGTGGTGGTGGGTTLNTFLYVGNRGANPQGSISMFELFTGGLLTALGSRSVDLTPSGIAVSADKHFLFVSHITPTVITAFRIEVGGLLTPLVPPTVPAVGAAWGIFAHPTKNALYLPDATNNRLYQFTVEADGSLTPMTPAFLSTGSDPRLGAFSPSGNTLYVAYHDGSQIGQFTVNVDGSLDPHTTPLVATGDGPAGVSITSDGKFAYVACETSKEIRVYSLAVDEGLAAVSAHVTGVRNAASIISDDNKFFYTADFEGTLILQFQINFDGSISALAPSTVLAGDAPMPIFVVPGTNIAYVANQGDRTIWLYQIQANGQMLFVQSYTTGDPGASPASFGLVKQ